MDEEFIEQQERIRNLRASTEGAYSQQHQQSLEMQEQEKGILKEQLDLSEELERIEHLLRGEVLVKTESGGKEWMPPPNEDMIVLSDDGIHLILSTIQWYINKNTLLSNYDEETINIKMEDFSNSLNDAFYMNYEKFFKTPSEEEVKKVLMKRIKQKVDIRKFTSELIGKKINEKEYEESLWEEIGGKIEDELVKIKQNLMKNKLKRFDLLLRVVQDAVHSTYLRAYKGIERRTIREHIQVTESKGGIVQPAKRKSVGEMFGWKKRV